MIDQMEDRDNGKSQAVKKYFETLMSIEKERPRENNRISIAGRPNINEISKRNEAIIKQERETF